MGEGLTEESREIAQQPALISDTQKDLQKLDVLVCGDCHEVFHFVEDIVEHKSPGNCSKVSTLMKSCKNESKVQVWAFTLWKHKQLKIKNEGDSNPSCWSLYQRWCKLSQTDKDLWIAAGDAIQWQSKTSNAKMVELGTSVSPVKESDPLALEDSAKNIKADGVNIAVKSDSIKTDGKFGKSVKIPVEHYAVEKILAKRFTPRRKTWEYKIKWENFSEEEATWEPLSNLESCKVLVDEFEENLRKLKVAKAAKQAPSPRGRGRPRLSSSPAPSNMSTSSAEKASGSRPQRTSKQKALNQVKAWCGNISDGEEGSLKRPYEEDSSDDSFEKKIKLEAESEDTDDEFDRKVMKKTSKTTVINNGVSPGTKLPDNILIPDAKGVVRINQKQLPSLSSGVYIMSKTAGIIKLDSAASKIATSGGQAIVKVAPKIGQTHIKIVKKDGATTSKIIPNSSKVSSNFKHSVTKSTKLKSSSIAKVKKILIQEKQKKIQPEKQESIVLKKHEEEEKSDSDYGLEELEFPSEMSLPEPESPPGDFSLDPTTGKIAGVEYPEPEPQPESLSLPEQSEDPGESKVENDQSNAAENSLDNLVKLAAADITEEDLQPLPPNSNDIMETSIAESTMNRSEVTAPSFVEGKLEEELSETTNVVSESKSITAAADPKPVSTVHKSMKGTTILKQTLQNPTVAPRPKGQQKILNQNIISKPATAQFSPIVRTFSNTRKVIAAPKPKFQISQPRYSDPSKVTYSRAAIPRKIGSTTIYKSISSVKKEPMKPTVKKVTVYQNPPTYKSPMVSYKMGSSFKTAPVYKSSSGLKTSHVYRATTKKEPVILNQSISPIKHTKPKPVISMPSLTAEDEPLVEAVQEPTTSIAEEESDLSSFALSNNESPIFLTGDDGTVYQVAGQDENGQTILITQGADGQQQCLLVTSEATQEDPVVAPVGVQGPLSIKTDEISSDQVVAQVVRTEPPSPGGTHKVVVMLPDGNLMVTQVSPEEYASLELDK